jgi:exopolysaccharide biosynthesis polyprenyl glycosylphosphotransferase
MRENRVAVPAEPEAGDLPTVLGGAANPTSIDVASGSTNGEARPRPAVASSDRTGEPRSSRPATATNAATSASAAPRRRPVQVAVRALASTWSLRALADVAAVLLGMCVVPLDRASIWFAIGALISLGAAGTYRRHLSLSALAEAPRLFMAVGITLLGMSFLSIFIELPGTLLRQAIVTGVAVFLGRTCTYAVIREARRSGRLGEPAAIIGAGSVGIELHRQLLEHPEYGLEPVGLVDDVPADPELPLLGGLAELPSIIEEHGVRRVLVAYGPTGEQELIAILRSTVLHGIELHVVPRFFELGLAPTGPDIEDIWGIPIYRVRRAALRDSSWKVKRVADVIASSILLVLLAPVLGLLALLVRTSSPGPILFRQRRIGQHGGEIEVLKFRTLRVNTDADITWSVEDDPRQTSVGRIMRRLSLDELPQLWNVLRGDMALVGPRPERPLFVSRFSAQVTGYGDRHRLPVGLTGLAQVHGLRGDTSIEERARFDNSYIEHWSPWLDMKIMILTLGAVVRDAFRRGHGEDEPEPD